MSKKGEQLPWVRLDTAATIFPAASRKNWSNVFRESITLTEDVHVDVLRDALDATVKRFPSICTRLRRGLFWYYLQQVEEAPEVMRESSYPLVYMSREEIRRCAIRVLVYHNRIAVEFFHSVTDGTGGMIFLKTLVAEYLERRYGIKIPCEQGVLSRDEHPTEAELENSFHKYSGPVAASRKSTNAFHIDEELQTDGFLHLTCFRLPVKETLALAHEHNATVTVFLCAAMMKALLAMQAERVPNMSRRRPVKIHLPVNLRSVFPSETLRNFMTLTTPELDARLGEYEFDEICEIIKHRMGLDITPKYMSGMIAANVNIERNPLVRIMPLPIKNIAMRIGYDSYGEKKACLTMSNLGVVRMPEEMSRFVERVDFMLGSQSNAPYNCAVVSFGDTLNLNFIRDIESAELERRFYEVLRDMGLPVMVESNRN